MGRGGWDKDPQGPKAAHGEGTNPWGVTKGLVALGRVWPEIEEILFILIALLQI